MGIMTIIFLCFLVTPTTLISITIIGVWLDSLGYFPGYDGQTYTLQIHLEPWAYNALRHFLVLVRDWFDWAILNGFEIMDGQTTGGLDACRTRGITAEEALISNLTDLDWFLSPFNTHYIGRIPASVINMHYPSMLSVKATTAYIFWGGWGESNWLDWFTL